MVGLCTPQELNKRLNALSRGQVIALAELADVPFSTLYMRAPDRDIMLSAAIKVLEVLPLVQRLNLPTREGYKQWERRSL